METENSGIVDTDSAGVINSGTENITSDEKLFAMFAHLSMFFGSMFIPLIFWAVYHHKSKFVSFHSLQSLFFHIAYTVVLVLLVLFSALIGFLTGLIKPGSESINSPDAIQIIVIVFLGAIVIGFILGSMAFAIYLAIKAYKGGLNKYPVIGNIIYKKVYGTN